MDEMKKNWLTIVVTAAISILSSLMLMGITFKHESSKEIDNKIDAKIDKVEAITYIDKNVNSVRYELQVHKDDDSKRLESMDKKLDMIIQKLIK